MDYMFTRHYIFNQPAAANNLPRVLLAEPEPEALAVYARHLSQARFLVSVCLDLDQLLRHVEEAVPHLLILNPGPDLAVTVRLLEQASRRWPKLLVITVGRAIPDAYLDRLMASGVSLHLNRSLCRPVDIAIAARHLLAQDSH
jgi:hypothetical protein